MPTLDIRDLTVNYAVKGGTLQALAPVNLKMKDGDRKSTRLNSSHG